MPIGATSGSLADRLVASVSQAGSARAAPGCYRVLLQLLAQGEPVAIPQLAAAAGLSIEDVQRMMGGWRDTEYDRQGRIVGYGLTLHATSHRFAVDGKQLYAWCALDTLFLPAVIARPARVDSSCAATGLPVRLAVEPDAGVTALEPATAVVSIVTPEGSSSVRASFCNPGRFFATRDAARDWQGKHPGMEVLSVVDAYQAGRSLSAMLLGRSTSHACCAS